MDDDARARFRSRWRELLEGDPTKSRIYKDMGNGVATAGIEYYLPLFFDETATVFDYLGGDATVVLHGDLEPAFQHFWQDTRERYRLVQGDPERPALPPEALFLSAEQFYARAKPHAQLAIAARRAGRGRQRRCSRSCPTCRVVRGAEDPLATLQGAHAATRRTACWCWPKATAGAKACSTSCAPAASARRPSTRWPSSRPATRSSASPPPRWPPASPGARRRSTSSPRPSCSPPRRPRAGATKQEQVSDVEALIKDLSELNVGDPVVHAPHGIGRYRGLVNMDLGQGRRRRVPAPGIRRQGHALRAGEPAAPDQPLHRRARRRGAAAQAGLGPVGKGQAQGRRAGARLRRRAAQHLCPPRRARRPCLPLLGAGLRDLRQRLRLRGNGRPEGRDPRRDPGHDLAAADGPAGLRRRGLRQDRGGAARRLRRRHRRQAGGLPRADHAAGRAALPDAGRPLRQVAGEGGRDEPLPLHQGDHRRRQGPGRRQRRHRGRHAQAAVRGRSSSRTWACSSSTRSTASACATRRR